MDPVLLWLWRRAAAIALNQPLAGEPPHAVGAALKKKKPKKKKKNVYITESLCCTAKINTVL